MPQPPGEHLPWAEYARRVTLAAAIAAGAAGALVLLWLAASMFALLFAGLLLAVLLRTLACWVGGRLGLGPRWSLLIVLAAIAAALTGFMTAVAPQLGDQFTQLADQVPRALESLRARLSQYRTGRWLLENLPDPAALAPRSSSVLGRITDLLSGTLGAIASAAIVLFVGVYVAANPHLYERGAVSLVPLPYRTRARAIIRTLYDTLRWWLIGQLVIMAVVGVLTGLGLWFAGVRLALALALIAALAEFVPLLGPYLAAVPILLVASGGGGDTVLWALIVVVVVQAIEGYILTPLVFQRTVYLPPALTIGVQLILGVLLGPIGVIIAAPAAAVGLVLTREVYVKDALGDPAHSPGAG